jgi:hypothetical protein
LLLILLIIVDTRLFLTRLNQQHRFYTAENVTTCCVTYLPTIQLHREFMIMCGCNINHVFLLLLLLLLLLLQLLLLLHFLLLHTVVIV